MNSILQGIRAASLGTAAGDETGTLEGRYLFSESFSGFAGHFPEYPILPAIVEIMTVAAMVGEHAGCRQRVVAVEDAKFLKPVRPNQELLVNCRQRTIKGKLFHEAKLTVGEITVSSLLLELAPFEALS